MNDIALEIVQFSTRDVRIKCEKHGEVGVKSAYDPFLKDMTAISCEKCPDVLTEEDAYKRRPDLRP